MIVTRYMTDDPHARIVAHIFSPQLAPGETLNIATLGAPMFAKRDHPGDVWEPAQTIGPHSLYGMWAVWCDAQGFTVEVRS